MSLKCSIKFNLSRGMSMGAAVLMATKGMGYSHKEVNEVIDEIYKEERVFKIIGRTVVLIVISIASLHYIGWV